MIERFGINVSDMRLCVVLVTFCPFFRRCYKHLKSSSFLEYTLRKFNI